VIVDIQVFLKKKLYLYEQSWFLVQKEVNGVMISNRTDENDQTALKYLQLALNFRKG
jgi:hypothetical protein